LSKAYFATHHWPPPDPPEFVPEGWVPLFDAYKLVGEAQFGSEWADGEEMAARSAEEIADPKISREVVWAPVSNLQGRAPPLFSNKEAKIRARERGDWVWNQLRQWLYIELVPTVILHHLGRLYEVPKHKWGGLGAIMVLLTGETAVGSETGFVLVSHTDLLATINGEKINEEIQSAGYESPYLRFAREASQKLGLKEAEKVPKDRITTWLQENWPPELGECSRRKIDSMATFLRHPGDEIGGHFRKDRGTKGDTH
jgi:hypothetical protein